MVREDYCIFWLADFDAPLTNLGNAHPCEHGACDIQGESRYVLVLRGNAWDRQFAPSGKGIPCIVLNLRCFGLADARDGGLAYSDEIDAVVNLDIGSFRPAYLYPLCSDSKLDNARVNLDEQVVHVHIQAKSYALGLWNDEPMLDHLFDGFIVFAADRESCDIHIHGHVLVVDDFQVLTEECMPDFLQVCDAAFPCVFCNLGLQQHPIHLIIKNGAVCVVWLVADLTVCPHQDAQDILLHAF